MKDCFNVDLNNSTKNCTIDKFQLLHNQVCEIMEKKVFLLESELFRNMNEPRKKFMYDSIKNILPKRILFTKTLFEGYSGNSWDKWLSKIENKPNILILMRLKNGFEIAGFSENPFSKEPSNKGTGFLMSVTNMKLYRLKKGYEGKVAKYDQHIFGLGNNELLIRNNFRFSIIVSQAYCCFDTVNVDYK